MPKISIITVNLDNAKGLWKTIKSVEFQTYADYEYIIIDGGSTDSSLDVIKEYLKIITYWVSEPDRGIYDALNKGIKIAKGEWVIFMNSGDVFFNNNVLQNFFLNNIETTGYILYGNTIVKENNKKIKPPGKINKHFFFNNTICHQSIFFKRTIFELIGYFNLNYKIISDREFLLRAAIRNLNFRYVDIDVCVWQAEGFSSKNSIPGHNEVIEMQDSYYNIIEQFLLKWVKLIVNLKYRFLKNKQKK